jgi:hypothetical protein
MNYSQLWQDIETNCLIEIKTARHSYYDSIRALTARVSFYVYPDDSIVALHYVDGTYTVLDLDEDDIATLRHSNREYF